MIKECIRSCTVGIFYGSRMVVVVVVAVAVTVAVFLV
jgi:hypothetical protein